MSNNITPKENELLRTQEGAFAAIMGYLKAERGKIAPSVFNKMVTQLGYSKQQKSDLVEMAEKLNGNPELNELYNRAVNREIKLDDIPNVVEDPGELQEKDLFEQVTSYLIDNEDNNARLREMRKLQREGIYMKILMDNVKKHLTEELKGMPRAKYLQTEVPKPQKGDKSLVLLLSDWHVGALVFNKDTGGYSFEKLKGKVQNTITQILQMVQDLDIKHVYVLHLGDTIEHVSMRNVNQAFESEFPATEQIGKSTRLITDMLTVLSKQVHITFGMIAGNHDRFEGNKNDKIHNDTITYLILDTLFLIQEQFGGLPNVTLLDNRDDTYDLLVKVAGKNIKAVHGDHEGKAKDQKIPKHIKDEAIDFLVMGHIHTTRIIQEDFARFHVYVGSTMGANNYSKEHNFPTTFASQMVIVLTEGSDTPYFVPLFDI